ncbi:MAG TPA: electron transfer flavoprotein subunit alpha/FixB family protein [Bryobacteraceae bacterium]|jgi:electron transfer flavoprotein alpha subunit|nr:electron transfer flavoprotein subunit alpha/FixB family protein [Bryobacteraceae bacterium]
MSILVILEQRGGKWNRMSFETLTAAAKIASELGTELDAALVGSDVNALAEEAASYELRKVYVATHPLLEQYTPEGMTAALQQLIGAAKPQVVLFPHSYQVRDYAPKLATRFGKALASDVIAVHVADGEVRFIRQLFQGKLNAEVQAAGEPRFASIQAGAFRAAEAGAVSHPVETFTPNLDASQIRSKPEAPFREAARAVDLSAADTIVSVGRGIKDKDSMPVVEALAEVLGAELAASRPICDNGWLPMERQVGSSGQTVSPKVYFAVGISGAIQHLVGMKGSKTVVAINKDESAPIFEMADYGVVGDLFEVVPALVEELKKAKA